MRKFIIKERPTTIDGQWVATWQIEAATPAAAARAAARYAINAFALSGRLIEAKAVSAADR